MEDVSFPHILERGLVARESIELLISGEYEGTDTQEIYNSHEWHLFGTQNEFGDRFLIYVFTILHAGQDSGVNITNQSGSTASTSSSF